MPLQLQTFDPRDLPATLSFNGHTLTIIGTAAADVATVYDRGATLEVVARSGSAAVQRLSVLESQTQRIVFIGGQGNDSFTNLTAARSVAYGNDGNDTLQGGSREDVLLGGLHNDVLRGHAGNDYLDGGSGADNLDGGTEHDWLLTEANDLRAVNGRRVTLNAAGTAVTFLNGGSLVALPVDVRSATSTLAVPFQAVHETNTLSPELLSGILFPVFTGR